MEGALAGAALGKGVSDLFDIVKDVTRNSLMFEDVLEHLKYTLARLKPVVEEIEASNRELGRPEETKALIEKMKKGEDCVRKYSEPGWWKFLMRSRYASKLCKLEETLIRFFQLDVQAWNLRNGLETLKGVNDIRARMNGVGSCAVPEPPDFTVGLDGPLRGLKMELLKKEVSILVLTAPGGCGKTTLVKMLCRDEEFTGN
jgi:hypothetical protein